MLQRCLSLFGNRGTGGRLLLRFMQTGNDGREQMLLRSPEVQMN